MKLLTPSDMISLLPHDEVVVGSAVGVFEDIAPIASMRKGYLQDALQKGIVHSKIIGYQDKPVYVVFYHTTDDNLLWINGVQSVADCHNNQVYIMGCEMLKDSLGCVGIRTMPLRSATVRLLMNAGFTIHGIVLGK